MNFVVPLTVLCIAVNVALAAFKDRRWVKVGRWVSGAGGLLGISVIVT